MTVTLQVSCGAGVCMLQAAPQTAGTTHAAACDWPRARLEVLVLMVWTAVGSTCRDLPYGRLVANSSGVGLEACGYGMPQLPVGTAALILALDCANARLKGLGSSVACQIGEGSRFACGSPLKPLSRPRVEHVVGAHMRHPGGTSAPSHVARAVWRACRTRRHRAPSAMRPGKYRSHPK